MDNPYVLATTSQKMATILFVGLMYLKLLFYPYPLTYDYSFHQIPYHDFSDGLVIFSLAIYAALGFIALWLLRKKDVISWCIFFFFGSLFIISNLLFNIGAPMAERFLYQASLPFIIAITELVRRFFAVQKQSQLQRTALISFLIVGTALSSFEIINRNEDWKSDETLFLHDVKTSLQSARANTYAGIALVRLCDASKDPNEKKEKATEAIGYFKKSLQIKSDYLPTLLNMGVAYSRIDSGDSAEKVWNLARTIEPDNSTLKGYDDYLSQFFFRSGMQKGGKGNYDEAIIDLEKAAKYNPSNADTWYNLGGAYFTVKNYSKAEECWKKTLQLNPNYKQAQQGLQALQQNAK
jgi:tetratricopeptide (TPR) repeat protein